MITKLPNNQAYLQILRTASNAVTKAIVETHYPGTLAACENRILTRPSTTWNRVGPRAQAPETILGLLRDPVERFRSACGGLGITAAEGLSSRLPEFWSVSSVAHSLTVTWFIYETQLEEFCAAVGIDVPAVTNASQTKPSLTDEELAAVHLRYAADIELYESLLPEPEEEPAQLPIPESIANWRAKAVLSLAGILPAVEAALSALNEPAKTIALSAWNGGAEVHRYGPTVAAAASSLGLTDAQLDAMFLQAAALQV